MTFDIQYLTKKAEDGDPIAAHELGILYYTGRGVEQSDVLALKWLMLASKEIIEDNYLVASILLNSDTIKANGSPLDYLNRSQSTPMSMYALHSLYRYGRHVEPSKAEAFKWAYLLNELEDQILEDGLTEYGYWVLLAANHGDRLMQYLAGRWYDEGIALGYSTKDSLDYLSRSAQQMYPPALEFLAYRYEDGDGVKRSHAKCMELLRSAGQGDPGIMNIYGDKLLLDYVEGSGKNTELKTIRDDAPEFIRAYEIANTPESLYKLGLIYLSGTGVRQTRARAFQYFRDAGVLGHPYALYELCNSYDKGIGTDKAPSKAKILSDYITQSNDRDLPMTNSDSTPGNIISTPKHYRRCPGVSISDSEDPIVEIDWLTVLECVSALSDPLLASIIDSGDE